MDANKKTKFARVLGSICLAVGAVNLILFVVDRPQSGSPLLVTGVSALTTGFILVAVSKRKPTPGD